MKKGYYQIQTADEMSGINTGGEDQVLMVQDGNVATVTLNRPEKLNALNKNMWTRVGEVFRALNDDEGGALCCTPGGR